MLLRPHTYCPKLENVKLKQLCNILNTGCVTKILQNWSDLHKIVTESHKIKMKKALRETQTLHAGYSKAKPKITPRRKPLLGGVGRPKLNQLERVTTFTYRPSLVKIDARNFELS